jgi:hypothetical protein
MIWIPNKIQYSLWTSKQNSIELIFKHFPRNKLTLFIYFLYELIIFIYKEKEMTFG